MHQFEKGKCVRCGNSQEAAEAFGFPCSAESADSHREPADLLEKRVEPSQLELTADTKWDMVHFFIWAPMWALAFGALYYVVTGGESFGWYLGLTLGGLVAVTGPFDPYWNRKFPDQPMIRATLGGLYLASLGHYHEYSRVSQLNQPMTDYTMVLLLFLLGALLGWLGARYLQYLG